MSLRCKEVYTYDIRRKKKNLSIKKEGYQWAVIDSCTQIMAVNQVRLLLNESGVFL